MYVAVSNSNSVSVINSTTETVVHDIDLIVVPKPLLISNTVIYVIVIVIVAGAVTDRVIIYIRRKP